MIDLIIDLENFIYDFAMTKMPSNEKAKTALIVIKRKVAVAFHTNGIEQFEEINNLVTQEIISGRTVIEFAENSENMVSDFKNTNEPFTTENIINFLLKDDTQKDEMLEYLKNI